MQKLRRQELMTVTQRAIDCWVDWQQGDPAAIVVPEALRQAWVDLVSVWGDGSIPADCRELARLVERFDKECLTPWLTEMDTTGQQAILPGNEFWRTLEEISRLLTAVESPGLKPLEPIADLVAQGVTHAQIARIYGFTDARGNFSEQMVREELAKPGTHLGDGWVDPRMRRQIDRRNARMAAVDRAFQAASQKVERRNAQPRESLADLIDQQVPLEQIARIFRVSEEEIVQRCEEQGLALPGPLPPSASMAGVFATEEQLTQGETFAKQAERRRAEQSPTDEQPAIDHSQTVEQQIVACHLQGLSVRDTVQALTHEAIGERKVRAVLKRYQDDPSAFGEAVAAK